MTFSLNFEQAVFTYNMLRLHSISMNIIPVSMSTAYEWKEKLALRVALSKNNIDKEAVTWGCSVKNVFLEIHRKTTVPKACKFIKK